MGSDLVDLRIAHNVRDWWLVLPQYYGLAGDGDQEVLHPLLVLVPHFLVDFCVDGWGLLRVVSSLVQDCACLMMLPSLAC